MQRLVNREKIIGKNAFGLAIDIYTSNLKE